MRRLVFFSPLLFAWACVGDTPVTTPDAGDAGDATADAAPPVDATTDTTGPSDAGADADASVTLDPRTLSGLRLWLESTQGVTKETIGTTLDSWTDSSGRWADAGPDGGLHVAVPNGSVGAFPGVNANGLASRPSISISASGGSNYYDLIVANHADFDVGTGDFLIAVVAKIANGTGSVWRLMRQQIPTFGVTLNANGVCASGGVQTGDYCTTPQYAPSTDGHVLVARRKSSQLLFRVDGVTRGTYDFGAANPNLGVATYQSPGATIGQTLDTEISEVIVIVGTSADTDVTALEDSLKAKYAIP